MNIVAIAGLGITAAALSSVIRRSNSEYGLMLSLCASLLILGAVVASLSPVISLIEELVQLSETESGYISVLVKALVVCYITQLAADCCRDSGESSIASKIEFAGKIAVLLVAVPLYEGVIGIVKELVL